MKNKKYTAYCEKHGNLLMMSFSDVDDCEKSVTKQFSEIRKQGIDPPCDYEIVELSPIETIKLTIVKGSGKDDWSCYNCGLKGTQKKVEKHDCSAKTKITSETKFTFYCEKLDAVFYKTMDNEKEANRLFNETFLDFGLMKGMSCDEIEKSKAKFEVVAVNKVGRQIKRNQ